MLVPSNNIAMFETGGKRHRTSSRVMVGAAATAAGVVAGPLAVEAWDYQIDKWWENQLGSWPSNNWTTEDEGDQKLLFRTCSSNYSSGWEQNEEVEIQLVEVQDWQPDPIIDSWKYACNNNDAHLVSGNTNSTKFHFDFEVDNIPVRTNGTMSVFHW